jgi:hypothetical protein
VRKKKKVQYAVISAFVFLVVASFIIIMIRITPEPPVEQIRQALFSISAAKQARAGTFSRDLMKRAQNAYDSAWRFWQEENQKWILLRNYVQVIEYAEKADRLAQKARHSAL